jgi:hypothetical protein
MNNLSRWLQGGGADIVTNWTVRSELIQPEEMAMAPAQDAHRCAREFGVTESVPAARRCAGSLCFS